jgi:FKBP-type peptidyl-prolyl cis-trans isomerase FkpA
VRRGGAAPDGAPDAPAVDPAELDYAPELGVNIDAMERSPTGLFLRDLEEGEGTEAEDGRTVVVHYTGALPNGTVFDSSRQRDEPFPVDLGQGRVIPGWEEGLQGMRPGGRRLLVIPPDLAYGAEGAGGGVIPPHATLVFDVEVLEVR